MAPLPYDDVAKIIGQLLDARQPMLQEAESVWQALHLFESTKADFTDCLIERLASAAGCTQTVTFDRRATKLGMTLLTQCCKEADTNAKGPEEDSRDPLIAALWLRQPVFGLPCNTHVVEA